MRKFCVALFGLVLFSALVFNVSANTWPNWDEAVIYRDSIGETIEQEDITVCYVTHDENYIFFRVEFAGGTSGSRALLVYLDVDQDAGTGDSGSGASGSAHRRGGARRLGQVHADPAAPPVARGAGM